MSSWGAGWLQEEKIVPEIIRRAEEATVYSIRGYDCSHCGGAGNLLELSRGLIDGGLLKLTSLFKCPLILEQTFFKCLCCFHISVQVSISF